MADGALTTLPLLRRPDLRRRAIGAGGEDEVDHDVAEEQDEGDEPEALLHDDEVARRCDLRPRVEGLRIGADNVPFAPAAPQWAASSSLVRSAR